MRLITLFTLLAIGAGALLLALPSLPHQILNSTPNRVKEAADENLQNLTDVLLPLTQHISTPSPLRGQLDSVTSTTLSTSGVFANTNTQRQQNNLPPLKRDTTLDQAAQNKLQDMFTHQYFDHVSPSNIGPGDVVTAVGYDFLTTGENLALGNFASDALLVQAWMDSPGHRANILGQQFQAIGLAVGQGQFEGHTTWLAVQTFATPGSACPLPDATLKTTIDSSLASQTSLQSNLSTKAANLDQFEQELEQLGRTIMQLQTEGQQLIEAGNAKIEEGNRLAQEGQQDQAETAWTEGERLQQQGRTKLNEAQQQVDQYNQQVEQLQALQTDHNQLVDQLRTLDTTLQQSINIYNQQVRTHNTCADQFTS